MPGGLEATIIPGVMSSMSLVHVLATDERIIQACRALPAETHRLVLVTDIQQLLDQRDEAPCDVAVIDLSLNGYAACVELRSDPRSRGCRVVMICERAHDRWLCLQAGADAVLIKPLADVSALVDAVQALTV